MRLPGVVARRLRQLALLRLGAALVVAVVIAALVGRDLTAFAASDFLYNGVNCGQTSKSWNLELRATADNTEVQFKSAAHISANYLRQGGTSTAITTAALANVNSAYSSGGWIEVDRSGMKGLYRFDPPDAMWACGADWVVLAVTTAYGTAAYVNVERIGLASAPDVNVIRWNQTSVLATPLTANVTQWFGTNVAATQVDANLVQYNGAKVYATQVTANLTGWNGTTPNNLISGRVDANTQNTAANLTFGLTGNITGNLTGSVGSVTGAVGSVTNRVTANTDQWNGTAVIATNASVNVVNWQSAPPNGLINGRIPIAAQIQKNTAYAKFQFLMTDSTNHNPKTGLTSANLGCVRSIDGGAAATGTLANIAEVSSGYYTVDFGSGDLNGNTIRLTCTANSADDGSVDLVTWP